MSNETLEPSPAAQTIEAARVGHKMSVRQAASDAGLSEGRWRQIAKGYQLAARGHRIPVNTPAETLARMAAAVGLRADDMRTAGRDDVADAMHKLRTAKEGRGVLLDTDRYDRALAVLDRWIEDGAELDGVPLHPPADALWLWTPRQLAENLAEQVALLESAHDDATRSYFTQLRKGKQWPPPDQDAAQEAPHDHAAPTNLAGGSPASGVQVAQQAREASRVTAGVPNPDDLDLAAMPGTPAHAPDATTGEEPQDPGSDEPA